MLKKYDLSLQLTPEPSLLCRNFLIGLHILAAIASIANALPLIVKILLLFAACASLWFSLKQYVNDPERFTLRYSETSSWQLDCGADEYAVIDLAGSTVSTPLFVILRVKHRDGPKKSILIVKDSLDAEEFRRLRVTLKITGMD